MNVPRAPICRTAPPGAAFVLAIAAAGGIAFGQGLLLGDFSEEEETGSGVDGAALKTDSEVDELLERADQFAKQGRYDLASTLWQRVIDSSNDLVFTRDEWVERTLEHAYTRYRSVTADIEGNLAKLPEAGLGGYRIKADGEAKLLLAKAAADEREAALGEVVRRYFLSSVGDDAAFELACRKLDRYEFLPAIRLLDKLIAEYPSPSVERDEILLRLAALNARVGDPERALEIIGDLRSRVSPAVPDAVLDLVEADVRKARGVANIEERGDSVWPMIMGGAARQGAMPPPPDLPGGTVGEAWSQPFGLTLPEGWPELPKDDTVALNLNVDDPFNAPAVGGRSSSGDKPATPKSMLEDWPKHGWRPAGRALFHHGRIYFKNHNRLVCADAATGELRWLGFRTGYSSPRLANNRYSSSRSSKSNEIGRDPKDAVEVQQFSDSVHQGMCIVRDKILTLQGKPLDFTEEFSAPVADKNPGGRVVMARGMPSVAARMRDNRLVAYHARNGKLQWMRTAAEPSEEAAKRACFAGPPVPYGSMVLVPVLEETGMYLAALETEGGATLWRTFLGDEPGSGTAPHSAVMVAVAGGEAYVATGAGLVFSVDAISGSLNWAVRYPRSPRNNEERERQMRFGGFGNSGYVAKFDGWGEEMIIPAGNAVIVTPADFDHVVAFDRRSGELLWESARTPGESAESGDYALGVFDGRFYIAGNDVVRCYRVAGGRMLWEAVFEPGFGRGALTPDGVFVPSGKDKVVQLSLAEGEEVGSFGVKPEGGQPVGNLYTDGDHLFGIGLRRVYSIGEVKKKDADTEPSGEGDES